MAVSKRSQYFLVDASMLPEIFIKVTQAKDLLETGQAETVAEAVAAVGISRSAFYKYKDAVSRFQDMKSGRILTFSMVLRNRAGLLSAVLAAYAAAGANILTINQSLPAGSTAFVTVSAETAEMDITTDELLDRLRGIDGVIRLELLGG